MKIGVPKEVKAQEHRVGLVPHSVRDLVQHGHEVLIQSGAGAGIGISDDDYISSGASISFSADHIYGVSELIVKVKEPQPEECKHLRAGQIIFAFLHLAADPLLADSLVQSKAVAIAYETVTDAQGGLPILAPMSAVAGRLAVQSGAHLLEKPQGGRGVLLGGVSGTLPAQVMILGCGIVGSNAIEVALGMGARVTALDHSLSKVDDLNKRFSGNAFRAIASSSAAIAEHVVTADLLIGAVLVAGAAAPKLVSKENVAKMQPGAVVIDVAIDQGGCIETSRPTSFNAPTYVEYGVTHQCVTNLPGAVPRTSAFALNSATLPFILQIADKGYRQACLDDPHLLAGLNICNGKVTHAAVAQAIAQPYVPAENLLRNVTV